jgi:hypothetical protein
MQSTLRTVVIAGTAFAVGVAGSAGAAKLITGRDIQNGSVQLVDLSAAAKKALRGATGPVGRQGEPGRRGDAGESGPPGSPGVPGGSTPGAITTTVLTRSFPAAPGPAEGEVRCPSGMVALGGSVSPGYLDVLVDRPSDDGRGWIGKAVDNTLTLDVKTMPVSVICAPGTVQDPPTGS